MDTVQIICTLRDITKFRGVYPSDLLPTSIQLGTVIINAIPHPREGSHWLATHFNYPLSVAFYFDSNGRALSDPNILSFLKRNCAVWGYNTSSLQEPTSVVCGHYCCLFARYKDKGITPQPFCPPVYCWHCRSSGRAVLHSALWTCLLNPKGWPMLHTFSYKVSI